MLNSLAHEVSLKRRPTTEAQALMIQNYKDRKTFLRSGKNLKRWHHHRLRGVKGSKELEVQAISTSPPDVASAADVDAATGGGTA